MDIRSTSVCFVLIIFFSRCTFSKAARPSQATVIWGFEDCGRIILERIDAIPTNPYNSLLYELWEFGSPGTKPPPLIHSEPSGVDIIQAHAPTLFVGK